MRYTAEIAIPEMEALIMQITIVFGLHLSRSEPNGRSQR